MTQKKLVLYLDKVNDIHYFEGSTLLVWPVAQLVEQSAVNRSVVGSSPTWPAIF